MSRITPHLDGRLSVRLSVRRPVLVSFTLLAAIVSSASAQTKPAAQPQSSIPTPQSVFGFKAGADSSLFLYDQSIEYFRKLAKAAPTRVKLLDVGKTSMGH